MMVLLIKKECVKTIKESFLNQTYIDKINKDLIPVLVTLDQERSYSIELLYTFEYPTLFFLDKHELFNCEALRGNITPKRLKNHLELCK